MSHWHSIEVGNRAEPLLFRRLNFSIYLPRVLVSMSSCMESHLVITQHLPRFTKNSTGLLNLKKHKEYGVVVVALEGPDSPACLSIAVQTHHVSSG